MASCKRLRVNDKDSMPETSVTMASCKRLRVVVKDCMPETSVAMAPCKHRQVNDKDTVPETSMAMAPCKRRQVNDKDTVPETSMAMAPCKRRRVNDKDSMPETSVAMAPCKHHPRNNRHPVPMEWAIIDDNAADVRPTAGADSHNAQQHDVIQRKQAVQNLEDARDKIKKSCELKMKAQNQEKRLFMRHNKKLQKQLEAAMAVGEEIKRNAGMEIKRIQEQYQSEKKSIQKQNKELEKSVQMQKIAVRRLKKKWEVGQKKEHEKCCKEKELLITQNSELCKQLQGLKDTSQKLRDDCAAEIQMLEDRHNEEKLCLMRLNRDIQDTVQSLKAANEGLQENLDTEMNQKKELEKELKTMKIAWYQQAKDWAMRTRIRDSEVQVLEQKIQDLLKQLAEAKAANEGLQENLDTEMNQKKELEKELKTMKARQAATGLPLNGNTSQPQQSDGPEGQTLSVDAFQPISILGQGGFGTVILARRKAQCGSEQLYAVKVLQKKDIARRNSMARTTIEKEVLILTSGHSFITHLHSCFQSEEHLFFVMEFVSGGDLRSHLQHQCRFSLKRTVFYVAEVTLALQFLHKLGIVHRDLKPENILIGADGHCKVADFGLSKLGIFARDRADTCCGTPYYMAPEMLQHNGYGYSVDWWALGVVVYEMMTGVTPFSDTDRTRLFRKITSDYVQYPLWMPQDAVSVIDKLLIKDPRCRLGANGVRQQPFFRGINWKQLQEKRMPPPAKIFTAAVVQEDNLDFRELLKPDNLMYTLRQEDFEGFSHPHV